MTRAQARTVASSAQTAGRLTASSTAATSPDTTEKPMGSEVLPLQVAVTAPDRLGLVRSTTVLA